MCVGLGEAVAKSATEDIGCLRARELGESLRELRRCIDGLEADFSRRLARFNDLRGYELDGAVDAVAWLRSSARLTSGAAAERVNVAQKLGRLGSTEAALARGEIGFAHAAVIARAVDDVSPEAAPQMETLALEVAKGTDPSSLRHFTRQARALLDPEGLLDDANRAHERRRLSLNEDRDGLFVLDGLLDPEGGMTLKTALEALMGPKAKDDRRSAVQRRADALIELARRQLQGARGLPEVGGQRPHLTLTATVGALQGLEGAMPAKLAGIFPVPKETARRLSCDAAVTPLLLDGEGNHLDLGRTVRTVPPALRRALVARDRGCRFPDCDRPPEWCEGHHLDFWADGGETNKENLALLCARHHRLVHEGGWRLSQKPGGELAAVPP